MTELIKKEENIVISESNEPNIFLDIQKFELAQRVCTMLSKSTMVPDQFKGNVGNCMIALNLASRTNLDVFMVMQKIYIIHGKPGIEGQLAIALINRSGKFSPLKFDIKGEGKTLECRCYATSLKTGEECEQIVTWEMVEKEGWDKKKGSKWISLPRLMMQYRSATFFGRVFCPEALLGMMVDDELNDIYNEKAMENSSLSQKLKQLPKRAEVVQPTIEVKQLPEKEEKNPLYDTPEWIDWADTAEAFPHITSKMMEPVTVEQCIAAVKQVQQIVDQENA